MPNYATTRDRVEHYFDRSATKTWERLTSDAPVSGIRATVRAGRDRMRELLLAQLPADLRGARILDAGCGTGALAVELAQRGADVVAVDISPALIAIARKRMPTGMHGAIDWVAGDMLEATRGGFDHAVAMDSLIHYCLDDVLRIVAQFSALARRSVLFTSAPWTPALGAMHFFGRLIPHRSHRAPAIEPVSARRSRRCCTIWSSGINRSRPPG